MINKDDLRGLKSPAAFQVLYTLLIGYFMVPAFGKTVDFKQFMLDFENATPEEKRDIIAKSVCVTSLKEEEYLACLYFCKDKNGISYTKENIDNLKYDEIIEKVIEVCLAFSECKVFF